MADRRRITTPFRFAPGLGLALPKILGSPAPAADTTPGRTARALPREVGDDGEQSRGAAPRGGAERSAGPCEARHLGACRGGPGGRSPGVVAAIAPRARGRRHAARQPPAEPGPMAG